MRRKLALVLCLLVAAMFVGGCTVNPKPKPPEPPEPPKPPAQVCTVKEADLVAVDGVIPVMGPQVIAAMTKLGDPTGKPAQETLAALAKELGNCAIAGVEAVFVLRPDNLWEEYHAVDFGSGGFIAQGKYKGGHRAGPPPATATGRPESSVFVDTGLVRNDGTGRWTMGGAPFNMAGATPCWPTDGTGEILKVEGRPIPYLWPLVSTEWMAHTKGKGANTFHMRPGPIGTEDTCCGLESVGGPYMSTAGDLNPKFWDLVHKAHRYAGENKMLVQDSILDGWVAKNDQSIGGDMHMPFPPADAATVFAVPINKSVRKWVFNYVREVCNYGNAIFEIGNETSLGPGWTADWERSMYALTREAEQQPGCDGIVHVVGSNSRDFEGPYDYMVSHWPDALTGPQSGKPMMINEYNPSLSPGQFKNLFCTAKKAGQTFFYWRSDGTDARQDESLNMLAACDAPPVCPTPQPDRSKLSFAFSVKPNGVVDCTPIVTKDLDYCTSIGKGLSPDGVTPSAACPMRNECPDVPGYEGMCEDRVVCEQYALSVPGVCNATAPLWLSDGEVVLEDAFGFRARCNGCTWLKACNCDGTNCGNVVFQ